MSHKFRFSKDSWERLKNFAIGEEPRKLEEEPETQEPPVEEVPEKNDKRSKKEKTILVCVLNPSQIPELTKIVASYPGSFVTVSQVSAVMGNFLRLDSHNQVETPLYDTGRK